jgi:hypothetical protein
MNKRKGDEVVVVSSAQHSTRHAQVTQENIVQRSEVLVGFGYTLVSILKESRRRSNNLFNLLTANHDAPQKCST